MICQIIQRSLLRADDPAHPPAEVRLHLAVCPACRAVQRRLLQIETNVPRLPVPPSAARSRLLNRLQDGPLETQPLGQEPTLTDNSPLAGLFPLPSAGLHPHASPGQPRSWRRWQVAGAALVATIGLFVLSWFTLRPSERTVPPPEVKQTRPAADPLVANLVERDLHLAQASTPRERVKELADIAADLHGETRAVVQTAGPEDLMELARLYQQVIQKGVLAQAQTVPEADRPAVLQPIGDQLAQAGRDAELLARDVPAVADPLQLMAKVAREGSRQCRAGQEAASSSGNDLPGPLPLDADRLRRLKQNRLLIQDLVDGGLRLASAEDSLKRALCCSDLAGSVAFEIRKAAEGKEGARAAEMGEHFQALLRRGIADNLSRLRAQTPPGSSQDLEMRRLAEQVARMAQPVEQQLQKVSDSDPEDIHHALKAVQGGRTEVEKSLAIPGRPPEISTKRN